MQDILSQLGGFDPVTAFKLLAFFLFGLIGMVFAYTFRWASRKVPMSWWQYMTGDGHAVGFAVTKLIMACWAAGGLGYVASLDLTQIINGGILLGMAMPDKVDEAKAAHKIAAHKINNKPVIEEVPDHVLDSNKRSV